MAEEQLGGILAELPRFRDAARDLADMILANLVMLGEIPAPTFGEETRIHMLQQRFSECGLQNVSTDETGNGLGILPGTDGDDHILVVSHADTLHPETVDHNIVLDADRAIGPGVGDNSLGLAALASLPTLLERLGTHLKSNLILMGGVRSLGHGNLEGLRFFLGNNALPIKAGVCAEGVQLGRLAHASMGMLRGEITCSVAAEDNLSQFGNTSAILAINDVINRIAHIRLPRKPRSNISFGSLVSGASFDNAATQAVLRFEIRSESNDIVRDAYKELQEIVAEINAHSGTDVTLNAFARRRPGGLAFSHPLPAAVRRIHRKLRVESKLNFSTSELSALIRHKIPAVTVGLTTGDKIGEIEEAIAIKPMFTGIAQLVGILLAIDGGFCDEH